MKRKLKEKLAKSIAFTFTFLTVFTVNSTCYLALGQDKEPKSLNRFKKIIN